MASYLYFYAPIDKGITKIKATTSMFTTYFTPPTNENEPWIIDGYKISAIQFSGKVYFEDGWTPTSVTWRFVEGSISETLKGDPEDDFFTSSSYLTKSFGDNVSVYLIVEGGSGSGDDGGDDDGGDGGDDDGDDGGEETKTFSATLSFDTNGGKESYSKVTKSTTGPASAKSEYIQFNLPTPTRNGYSFKCWYLVNDDNEDSDGYWGDTDVGSPTIPILPMSEVYSATPLAISDGPKEYIGSITLPAYPSGASWTVEAQWEEEASSSSWSGVSIYNSTTGKWENYDVYIYDSTANSGLGDWVKYDVYVYDGDWIKCGD